MRRMTTPVLGGFLGLLLVGGLAWGHGGRGNEKTVTREALRWTGKLPAGQTIRLRNVNGGLRVEAAAGETVEIVATESKPESEKAQVTVQVAQGKDGMAVCAIFPGEPGKCEADGRYDAGGDGNDGLSVDIVVKVPKGVVVDAMTVNGEVAIRGATAAVKATTVNGGVDVETTGASLKIETVNGQVRGRSGGSDVKAKSVNGSLEIVVPANVDAEVRADTVHGAIDNDFGLRVDGEWGQQTLRGKLGKGTGKVSLQTVNGAIRLRKP
jgi:hypothetical protein